MRIEVDYSGCGSTCSVLKWIVVGMAPHVALCALVFCEDDAVVELPFDILPYCWLLAGRQRKQGLFLVNVPLPVTKPGLTHSRLGSMRITTANVDAG